MSFFTHLYLYRYPILFAILLVFLTTFGLWNEEIRRYVAGLFDLRSFWPMAWATWFVCLYCWSLLTILRITMLYGPERNGLRESAVSSFARSEKAGIIFFFSGLVMPVFFFRAVLFDVANERNSGQIFGALTGILAALVVIFVSDLIQRVYHEMYPPPSGKLTHLIIPFDTPLTKLLGKPLWVKRIFSGRLFTALDQYLRWMRAKGDHWGVGYFPRKPVGDDKEKSVSIYPGHVLAIVTFLVYFLIYIIGFFYWTYGVTADPSRWTFGVTAISYLFLLLTLLVWAFGGIGFFFDRYRFPPLLVFLIFLFLVSPDHRYNTTKRDVDDDDNRPTPNKLFEKRIEEGVPFVIAVAANGGGIQAAAWTTEVLTQLDSICLEVEGFNRPCREAMLVVSGVSGGSVGSMFFMEAFDHEADSPSAAERLGRIRANARASSLDFVAGGMVFNDLPRNLIIGSSLLVSEDRGTQLVRGWMYNMQKNGGRPLSVPEDRMLSEWHSGGSRPAFIFNSTTVESDHRILFSTAKMDPMGTNVPDAMTFDEFADDGTDISVTDAVRLSAAFPVVSPAAKMRNPKCDVHHYHMVDGGYVENFGLLSVRDFLDQALPRDKTGTRPKLLVIRIVGNSEYHSDKAREDRKGMFSMAWYEQTLAPAITYFSVNSILQHSRDAVAVREIFSRAGSAGYIDGVDFKAVTFEFPRFNRPEPRSWHLTRDQLDDIDEASKKHFSDCGRPKHCKALNEIRQFIGVNPTNRLEEK